MSGQSASTEPIRPKGGLVRRLLRWTAGLIALFLTVTVLYGYVVLHWSYSEGERAGVLQKFSRKGWVFKTWEGELAMTTVPGVAPVLWTFSVRDEAVAQQVTDSVGQRVVLHYSEHRGIPVSWFGETNYFVESVKLEN